MVVMMKSMEVESERVFLVHDAKTGKIVHVHRVVTHRGAQSPSDDVAQKRALELAEHFGHPVKKLNVVRVDGYKSGGTQKVDVKSGKLIDIGKRKSGNRG